MISKNPLEIAQKLKENYENKRNFVFFSPAAAIINRKSYYNRHSLEKMPPEGRRNFLGRIFFTFLKTKKKNTVPHPSCTEWSQSVV